MTKKMMPKVGPQSRGEDLPRARKGKFDRDKKKEAFKDVAKDRAAMRSAGSKTHGTITTPVQRPHPQDLMPEMDKIDRTLAEEAERAFQREKHYVQAPSRQVFDGVPMNEELEPARVAEYCEREPFVLTSIREMHLSPKFGIIDVRFEAMAQPYLEQMDVIKALQKAGNVSNLPPRLQFRARTDDDFAALVMKLEDGGHLDQAYNEAKEKADLYMGACAQAQELYHRQSQKAFRELESSMDRRQIGLYAQNMWTRNQDVVTADYPDYVASYFNPDVDEQGSETLKKLASHTPKKFIKWMAFVINEIPTGGMNSDGNSNPKAPKRKPTMN